MSDTPPEAPVDPPAPEVVLGDAPQIAGSPWLITTANEELEPEALTDPSADVPPTDDGDA